MNILILSDRKSANGNDSLLNVLSQVSTFNRLAHRNALNLRPRNHLVLTARCADELKQAELAILRALEAGE